MTSVVPRTLFFWATHVTEARARGWPPGARGLVTVPSRAVCGEAPGAGGIQSATRDPGVQSCSPSLPDRWFLWGRPAAQVQRATHTGAGGLRCRPRGRRVRAVPRPRGGGRRCHSPPWPAAEPQSRLCDSAMPGGRAPPGRAGRAWNGVVLGAADRACPRPSFQSGPFLLPPLSASLPQHGERRPLCCPGLALRALPGTTTLLPSLPAFLHQVPGGGRGGPLGCGHAHRFWPVGHRSRAGPAQPGSPVTTSGEGRSGLRPLLRTWGQANAPPICRASAGDVGSHGPRGALQPLSVGSHPSLWHPPPTELPLEC